MLIHSVYFWLKEELTDSEKESFYNDLVKLKEITIAEDVHIGTPSTTDRPVIERSYDYALMLVFKGIEDHDKYQVDPMHKEFLANNKDKFKKVVIYDFD